MRCFKIMVACTLFCSALSAGAQVPASIAGAPAVVQEADRISPTVDPGIWSGFAFNKTALFVWDGATKSGLLFHVEPLPAGFVPADPARPGVGLGPVPADSAPISGPGPIAGRLGAWIPGDQVASSKPLPVAVQALYGQAFKVFEAFRGFSQPVMPQGSSYPLLDAEGIALLRAEGRILARAISSDVGQVPSLMAAFLSIRSQRLARLQAPLQTYEWDKELQDGLAACAGYQARLKMDPQGAGDDLRAGLESIGKAGVGATGDRFGLTGCALALALDKADASWKTEFEKTARNSLQPVISRAAGQTAPADMTFVGLDGLRAEESAAVAGIRAAQDEKLNGILKAPGLVVVIDLQGALAQPGIKWSNKFQPNGIMTLDDTREIRNNYYNLIGPGVLDMASSRPILIAKRKSITVGFDEAEKPYITLDGKPLELSAGQALTGSLEIKGARFTLKVDQAKLTYSPKTLFVTPTVPAVPAAGQAG